jgi:mono/diheme cytochrome c family protein
MRARFAAALAASCALLLAQATPADKRQVTLKEGEGKALVEAKCAVCHSLDYIPMNSRFLDRKGWEAEVTKMVKALGAPISPDDAARITDYLAAQYGRQ